MKSTMGIILTGGENNRLKEVSAIRSSSAIPVAGKYRAIDFSLSNMVNSGIITVGVITQYSFRSLLDHLGSGKEWDLDRRQDGLFLFPPSLSGDNTGWYRGTADAMYHNLTFLKRSNEEYVVIAQGNCVYKMLFDGMLDCHIKSNADMTIAYRDMYDFSPEELNFLGILSVDGEGRIIEFQEKPQHPKSRFGSMGVYILKRKLLIELLEESSSLGYYEFVKDVIIRKLNALRIFGYRFDGYWRNMSTLKTYYRMNMEILNPEIRQELFIENGKIYTKVKDEAPAKYNEEAEVRNSVVADGCIVEGTVENSVLFRGVTVKKGAIIKDSIIMQGSLIEENVNLHYTILDKNVNVSFGKCIKGESSWPVIIGKNVKV